MKLEIAGIRKGLSAYQIKIIAVIFMTLDHLAAYGFEIPVFDQYYSWLRLVGRIAAPLFFFTLTESVRYTRSRPKFLLRLYLGAVAVGMFVTVTNFFLKKSVGMFLQSNILFTFFYTAWYIILIEEGISAVKRRNGKALLLRMAGIAATAIPHGLLVLLNDFPPDGWNWPVEYAWLAQDIVASLISSPVFCEYGLVFIIMGILMYFVPTKYGKAAVLAGFSLLGYALQRVVGIQEYSYVVMALASPQYYMILAVPFILLYNGEKGRGNKWFFYCYYPLHRYIIATIARIYQLLAGV